MLCTPDGVANPRIRWNLVPMTVKFHARDGLQCEIVGALPPPGQEHGWGPGSEIAGLATRSLIPGVHPMAAVRVGESRWSRSPWSCGSNSHKAGPPCHRGPPCQAGPPCHRGPPRQAGPPCQPEGWGFLGWIRW